jgi:hypothetical protein
MLTIRREQMAVFQAKKLGQTLPILVQEFEWRRPQHFQEMGPEGSAAFVRQAVHQGLAWGIRKRNDVWALMDLMLEFGPEFASAPDRPWAQPILNSGTLSGTAKIKLVTAHLRGEFD